MIFILVSLCSIACRNPKPTEQVKINPISSAINNKLPDSNKIDTAYSPLTIKIDRKDSIRISRVYFNSKNHDYYHEAISLNGKQIYLDTTHYFIYKSKYNRVIKSNDKLLLFLENDGRPNFNYITAYSIAKDNKVMFIADCVYNDKNQGGGPVPFTDIDHDGVLEYGGFDLIEIPEHPDSIYYNPSEFYEIRNGTVKFDSLLAKKADIRKNGVYLSHFMNKDGNCCKLIKKPKQ
ncbi:hypothetical protein SAMN04488511_106148 [Pedobacter suwonensis]|uniref:Uncharacterized protein n=1 Tax=Pedobacter suwonensis TaxID=332999 RepID=A0A1I0T7W3_9SPHI|nr:hypothetical protein [Pedobacter suwonensis]SFA47106.1 hypothetical protein SAMN04488511_106148 [Pedobacter suwonensis]